MKPEKITRESLLSDLESILFYSQFIHYDALGIDGKKEIKKLKKLMKHVKHGDTEKYLEEGAYEEWM